MGADQYFVIYELEIPNFFEKPRIDKKILRVVGNIKLFFSVFNLNGPTIEFLVLGCVLTFSFRAKQIPSNNMDWVINYTKILLVVIRTT